MDRISGGGPICRSQRGVVNAPQNVEIRPSPRVGYLEDATCDMVKGWIWNPEKPGTPEAISLMIDEIPIGEFLANQYRADLDDAGIGDGRHGFAIKLVPSLSPNVPHKVAVFDENHAALQGSPMVVSPPSAFDISLSQYFRRMIESETDVDTLHEIADTFAQQVHLAVERASELASGHRGRADYASFQRRWGYVDTPPFPLPSKQVLVIDEELPATGRDAGSDAILSHMLALKHCGYEIHVCAPQSSHLDVSKALESQGIHCYRKPYFSCVEEVLLNNKWAFDVIYLHRYSVALKYYAIARQANPSARIIFSIADLHHRRLERQAVAEQRIELRAESAKALVGELTACWHADHVITHSTVESEFIRNHVKGVDVHTVPWAFDARANQNPASQREGIVFLGNFAHAPNVDAAKYLASEILPALRARNLKAKLRIVGSNMGRVILDLASEDIEILGRVENLEPIFTATRIAVAPLRYGAGIKGKVLASLAYGVPCVCTAVAAEGIATEGVVVPRTDDVKGLCDAIADLYSQPDLCDRRGAAGLAYVEAFWSQRGVDAAFESILTPISKSN